MKRFLQILFLTFVMMNLLSCTANRKIKRLYDADEPESAQIYSAQSIHGLPDPVKRYFTYALSNGQAYVKSLALKHGGRFRLGADKPWMKIRGEQHFTTGSPGFVWIGKTKMFNAHDAYIAGKGNLSVYLLGLIRIVRDEGEKIDQGELLRWLGESVWMPTNLLPDENTRWEAMDASHARLIFTRNDIKVSYEVEFAADGRILSMECMRYKGQGELSRWTGRLADYRKTKGMMVPHVIQGMWIEEDGSEFMYADFQITDMTHRFVNAD